MKSEHHIDLYAEPCDCYEKHGKCLHHNGGNYHLRVILHAFTQNHNHVVIIEETDTRDVFHGDKDVLLIFNEDCFELISAQEWTEYDDVGKRPMIIERFRDGEAHIVWQS